MKLLDRIRKLFSRKRLTLEEEPARRDAESMRDDMETLRTGAMTGSSPWLTHGGKESRGR